MEQHKGYKILHLSNNLTDEISEDKNWLDVTNEKDFASLNLKLEQFNICLLNIHLNWNGQLSSSNYGFHIARLLRLVKKTTIPIIFYSPIQKEYWEFEGRKDFHYKIFFGAANYYLEVPFDEKELEEIIKQTIPLSQEGLIDECITLCNLSGMVIDTWNHNIKFEADLDLVFSSVAQYMSAEQLISIQHDYFLQELKLAQTNRDQNAFQSTKKQLIEKCRFFLGESVDSSLTVNNDEFSRKKFKVLFIDDEQQVLVDINRYLNDYFEIISVQSSKEAIDTLNADKLNLIVAVVSDFRLFEDINKKTHFQNPQGFDILTYAARQGQYRALFALTSQDDELVSNILNESSFSFYRMNKWFLRNESQWQLFGQIIYQSCEEIEDLIINQPNGALWKDNKRKGKNFEYSLQGFYSMERYRRDKFFNEVENEADFLWQIYNSNKPIRYNIEEISTSRIDRDELKTVLILRRIYFAIYLSSEDTVRKSAEECVYEYFKKDNFNKISDVQAFSQLRSKLCISGKAVTSSVLLPEETKWLRAKGFNIP